LIALDTGQEFALGFGIAPGVSLEPSASNRLHQCREVTIITSLLIRRIWLSVVTPQAAI
jgi:hypothetical protein